MREIDARVFIPRDKNSGLLPHEARDAWVGSGVVDPSGASGRHVGMHYEFIARYALLPQKLLHISGRT